MEGLVAGAVAGSWPAAFVLFGFAMAVAIAVVAAFWALSKAL